MCNASDSSRSIENRNSVLLPLDLPLSQSSRNLNGQRSTRNDIPLDLTARNESFVGPEHTSNNDNIYKIWFLKLLLKYLYLDRVALLSGNENFQILPDFLSDGHNHAAVRLNDDLHESNDEQISDHSNVNRSPLARLREENLRWIVFKLRYPLTSVFFHL